MTIAVHSRWLATSTLFEHARPLIIPVERLSKHSDGLGYGFHHRGEFRVIDTYPNRYTRSYSLHIHTNQSNVKCIHVFGQDRFPEFRGSLRFFQVT